MAVEMKLVTSGMSQLHVELLFPENLASFPTLACLQTTSFYNNDINISLHRYICIGGIFGQSPKLEDLRIP